MALERGRRGQAVTEGILGYLRDLAREGYLVEITDRPGTGPCWRLTAKGAERLAAGGR
jgi:hypothetical protein